MRVSLFFSLVCSFLFSIAFAWAAALNITAGDTAAGIGSSISITNANGKEEITIFVKQPDETILTKSEVTDSEGKINIFLNAEETSKIGTYQIVAVRKGQTFDDGPITLFDVFASQTSSNTSEAEISSNNLKINEEGILTVTLRDNNGNPIQNHQVTILSSRTEDVIKNKGKNSFTDKNGKVEFLVSSSKEGESVLSIIDISTTVTLNKRVPLVFINDTNSLLSSLSASIIGTSSSSAKNSDNFGAITGFEVVFPDNVEINSDLNYLKVTAIDADNNIVKDFTGSIIIETPNDPDAKLPGDNGIYTFTSNDQGSFTFPLALIFSKEGTQEIIVYEYNTETEEKNESLSGKKEITTTKKINDTSSESGENGVVTIINPKDGSSFGSDPISLIGTAKENSDIKVFIDDEVVLEISTNEKGEFSGQIPSPSDGNHNLYIMQKEGNREVSPTINFSIDGTPPSVMNVILPQTQIEQESSFTLAILSEEGLEEVSVSIGDNLYTLEESSEKAGTYEKDIPSPKLLGDYSISATLIDSTGNKTIKTLDQKIIVIKKEEDVPFTPQNLKGEIVDNTVKISWDKLDIPGKNVVLYIIYGGEDQNNLKRINSVSKESTEKILTNIPTDTSYYFAVSAIDGDGKEGAPSEKIMIHTLPEEEITPSEQEETISPDTISTQEPMHSAAPDHTLQTYLSGSSVRLVWDKIPETMYYQVRYGIQPNKPTATRNIASSSNTLTIVDLIPNQTYYFQVQAYDNKNTQLYNFLEHQEKPISMSFSPLAAATPIVSYPGFNTETGPAMVMMLTFTILFFFTMSIVAARKWQ